MSTIERQAIIDCLSRLVTPGIKLTALADDLGARKQDYSELRATLMELVEEGVVHVLPGGAFALAPMGRKSDPHAKPVPPVPPMAPLKKPRGAEKTRAPKQAKKPGVAKLPWGRPVPKPIKLPEPREEYDPETGEIRIRDLTAAAPVAAAAPDAPVAPPKPGKPVSKIGPGQPTGRITVHPAGYGFVSTADGTVFVPAKYRGTSLDGDEVAVDTWPGVRGTEGRVIEVLKRGRARLTGIIRRAGRAIYLEPDDPRIAADF